jgi:pimeloyl-ACP methyl ester carboxylesterase
MARPRTIPDDHKAFAALPVKQITVGDADEQLAVHVEGTLRAGSVPLVCVAGYNRNMCDWAGFLRLAQQSLRGRVPIVLVDLKGRGRASDRPSGAAYSSITDAADLAQVLMALAAQRPALIAGTVLIDAGPVSDSRGLVRLRVTLNDLTGVRGEASLRPMLRRMVAADYPGIPETTLDEVTQRTHYVDKRGRLQPLFDPALIKLLEPFDLDDVLVPQWQLFRALGHAPMLLMRGQYTEQLRRSTFEEMLKQRRDAEGYEIEHQGSPALLDAADDVAPIAEFARDLTKWRGAFVSPPEA